MTPPLLAVRELEVSYATRAGDLPVLRRVSLAIEAGESLGLVGESGCGKSTLAFSLLRHLAPGGRVRGGQVLFRGRDLAGLSRAELRAMRGGGIGMVYQDAMSALNPAIPIGVQLAEMRRFHRGESWERARSAASAMLRRVRLPDPGRVLGALPHQLSGGQQQRVVIAMALLAEPALLVLDEPTTALDATVEAGIVALVRDLQRETGMALLFVSHSLGLVAQVCERVAVMYAGEVVETGRTAAVFAAPAHPYTRGLLACVPDPDGSRTGATVLTPIRGTVPSLAALPPGCGFGPRCDGFRPGLCDRPQALRSAGDGWARCVRVGEVEPPAPPPAVPRRVVSEESMLVAEGLEKQYGVDRRGLVGFLLRRPVERVRANRGVRLTVPRGGTVAIVGESGCGKSTFARIAAGLEQASAGTLLIDGVDVARRPVARRTATELRALQMVFQNPDETLNPSYPVGRQIARVVRRLGGLRGCRAVAERVDALLAATRLPPRGQAAPATRVVRRPEAADRHRPRLRRGSGAADRGRAGLRAGRVGARRRDRADGGAAASSRHHRAADQPRPRPRPRHGRRGGGDVSRPGDGVRPRGPRVRGARPPLHRGAARGDAADRERAGPRAGGGRAQRDVAAGRLPVPPALPARPRPDLPDDASGARAAVRRAQRRLSRPAASGSRGAGCRHELCMRHVLVVGGGIAGLLTAWALARRGVGVTLFEQGPLPNPHGSSFDEHRIIRHAYGALDGYARLIPGAFALWERLWGDLGVRGYEETGAAYFLRDDMSWYEPSIRSLRELGIAHRDVALDEAASRYPMINPEGLRRVVETAGAEMLFPATIVTALVAALPAMGVRLAACCPVGAVDADAGVVTAAGERHRGDAVVVAAGAWVDRLVPSLRGVAVPSRQAVVFLAPPADLASAWAGAPAMLNRSLSGGTYTLPPRRGTRLKVGDHVFSRRGDPDDDRLARPEDLERLLPALRVGFRDVERYAVLERRACFYTVTEDERFLVRPVGHRAWVLSACSGHGFKLAPAMAEAVAQALTGERPVDPVPAWAAALQPPELRA